MSYELTQAQAAKVQTLERLCPGTRFSFPDVDSIRINMPTRTVITRMPTGSEDFTVNLKALGITLDEWLDYELKQRWADPNYDEPGGDVHFL